MTFVFSSSRVRRLPTVVAVVGVALFAVLAVASRMLYDDTEDRLLAQRTSEAAAVLQVSVRDVRAPLDAAVRVASITAGDPSAFERTLAAYVGDDKPFSGAALYERGNTTAVATTGSPLALPVEGPDSATSMLSDVAGAPFVIIDLLDGDRRRLGYAVADEVEATDYVVYGERTLSDDPNVRRRTDQPFAGLDYAIYLGDAEAGERLLGSSLRELPVQGRTATATVPFGNTELTLVMTPVGHLSSDLFAALWWIVLAVGTAISVSFAALTQRLLDRRDTALRLAADNERLFAEQRQIAETLQLSLLPQHLDVPDGAGVAARYWPAGAANLIGGDFYDAFRIDETRWGLTIGDVCGKGIEAASLTGLARHTIRAAARNTASPSDVLRAVHSALRDHTPATYCTACFVFIDRPADGGTSLRISLGGHPHPLLRRATGTVEEVGVHGTLLGMIEPSLTDVTVDVDDGDMLVLYTDGLTDAPGDQAVPMEEIRGLLERDGGLPLEELADAVRVLKRRRRPTGSADDTALLLVRFGVATAAGTQPATATMVLAD